MRRVEKRPINNYQQLAKKIMHMKEMKKDKEKEKRYKKSALRKTLERNMQKRRNEPELTITPMEFSRWLKIYCEIKGLPEEQQKAKTLPESVVDGFGAWLGEPLR
jgi:hypothetical protein